MKKLSLWYAAATLLVLTMANGAYARPPTSVSNLTGTWENVNPDTRGTIRVVITQGSAGFRIRTFGSCSPTPCDHGFISAFPFSKAVGSATAHGLSGQYNSGFSTRLVTAQRIYDVDGGQFLELETRTRFNSGDTRYDYMGTELFQRR